LIASRVSDPDAAYAYLDRAVEVAGRLGEGRNDYNTESARPRDLHEIAVASSWVNAGAPFVPQPPLTLRAVR